MKLDNALEKIVVKLTNKYSPGLCPLHSNLPYFHHHASDLHFNLDCPQLLVWAQAIKLGTTIYEKVPIVSPMFKLSHALKHALKTSVTFVNSPTTSTLPTMPSHRTIHASAHSNADACDAVSIVFPIPSDAHIYGLWRNLGPQVESGLCNLGFEFRDDLYTVTEDQYTKAGFKPLEWQQVLKAYRQLKVDNCHAP